MIERVLLKVFLLGGGMISLRINTSHMEDFVAAVKSNREWIAIADSNNRESVFRRESISAYQIEKQGPNNIKGSTIPIKRLAEIFKVSPITITRNYAHTLKADGKLRRATLETALELHDHLLKSKSEKELPTIKQLKAYFD